MRIDTSFRTIKKKCTSNWYSRKFLYRKIFTIKEKLGWNIMEVWHTARRPPTWGIPLTNNVVTDHSGLPTFLPLKYKEFSRNPLYFIWLQPSSPRFLHIFKSVETKSGLGLSVSANTGTYSAVCKLEGGGSNRHVLVPPSVDFTKTRPRVSCFSIVRTAAPQTFFKPETKEQGIPEWFLRQWSEENLSWSTSYPRVMPKIKELRLPLEKFAASFMVW